MDLINEYGPLGSTIFDCILCMIYREGYYSQSWTMGSGSAGELYLSKLEKKLLGVGDRIGACSPLEGLCDDTRD